MTGLGWTEELFTNKLGGAISGMGRISKPIYAASRTGLNHAMSKAMVNYGITAGSALGAYWAANNNHLILATGLAGLGGYTAWEGVNRGMYGAFARKTASRARLRMRQGMRAATAIGLGQAAYGDY